MLDAAILGKSALGDIQMRQNLDARNQSARQLFGQQMRYYQDPVYALAYSQQVLLGFIVNVRGTLVGSLFQ